MTNALTHRRMIVFHGGQRSKVEGQREKNKQMKQKVKCYIDYKQFLCIPLAVLLSVLSVLSLKAAIPFQGSPPRVDTHIHLYDTRREGSVAFLHPERHEKVYFPHLAAQFTETASPAGVDFAVVVEASSRREDNYWLLQHVDTTDVLLAFIANLDPRDPWYESDLDSLLQISDKFRGIRIRPGRPFRLDDPQLVENLLALETRGLVLELGVNNVDPEDLIRIARLYPRMPIIINHLAGGNMRMDENGREEWKRRMAAFASEPNVYCKVSALFDLSGQNPAPLDPDFYAPLIDPVIDAFGSERVMFGSNWTLSDLFGTYKDMICMLETYISGREDITEKQLFLVNTLRAYGVAIPY